MAWENTNPTFIGKIQPNEARLQPTAPVDQTAGILGQGADAFGSFLDTLHKNKVQNLMDQAKLNDIQSQTAERNATAGFKNAAAPDNATKLHAEAIKAMAEVTEIQRRVDAMNAYIDKKKSQNGGVLPKDVPIPKELVSPTATPTDASTVQPDTGNPVADNKITAPIGTPDLHSHPIMQNIANDPRVQKAQDLADFNVSISKSMSPMEGAKHVDEVTKQVAKDHIAGEFQNQMDAYRMAHPDEKDIPKETARKIFRSIPGANLYMPDPGSQEEVLKDFPTQMDLDKLKNAEDNAAIEHTNASTRIKDAENQRVILNDTRQQTLRDNAEKNLQSMYDKAIGGARGNLGLAQVDANLAETRQMLDNSPTKLEASLVKEKIQRIINPSYGISKQIYASTTPGGELDKLWNTVSNIFAGGNKYMTDNQKKQVEDVLNTFEEGAANAHDKLIQKMNADAMRVNKLHPAWGVKVTPEDFSFDKGDYSDTTKFGGINTYNQVKTPAKVSTPSNQIAPGMTFDLNKIPAGAKPTAEDLIQKYSK